MAAFQAYSSMKLIFPFSINDSDDMINPKLSSSNMTPLVVPK